MVTGDPPAGATVGSAVEWEAESAPDRRPRSSEIHSARGRGSSIDVSSDTAALIESRRRCAASWAARRPEPPWDPDRRTGLARARSGQSHALTWPRDATRLQQTDAPAGATACSRWLGGCARLGVPAGRARSTLAGERGSTFAVAHTTATDPGPACGRPVTPTIDARSVPLRSPRPDEESPCPEHGDARLFGLTGGRTGG